MWKFCVESWRFWLSVNIFDGQADINDIKICALKLSFILALRDGFYLLIDKGEAKLASAKRAGQ
jgi:hypothetical protein